MGNSQGKPVVLTDEGNFPVHFPPGLRFTYSSLSESKPLPSSQSGWKGSLRQSSHR